MPSRRWEAWREGVEDYQYLYELQAKINLIKKTDAKRTADLQKRLDEKVDMVLDNPNNPDIVYEVRGAITKMLKTLF